MSEKKLSRKIRKGLNNHLSELLGKNLEVSDDGSNTALYEKNRPGYVLEIRKNNSYPQGEVPLDVLADLLGNIETIGTDYSGIEKRLAKQRVSKGEKKIVYKPEAKSNFILSQIFQFSKKGTI